VPTNPEKLRSLLEELFQLDQADLDFGIYRIMNAKRDEIVRFLNKDLLPQVKAAFSKYKSADKVTLQKELDEKIAHYKADGINPDTVPKVKELRQQIAESAVDVTALENEVFSHLFNFFRRYYSEGDFISLRRYKEGVYAIPYEGEEVKLHWANADQYYVKSSEYFKDYIFTMPSGKRVRVHLGAASTEQDNNKAAQGKERRFFLCEENPIYEESGELFIRFEYRPSEGKEKQDALNKAAIESILKSPNFEEWMQELSKPAPTEKNKARTVLEKHLFQYTARNTFDYFIHKDLGGFLRRELDFYIKNEVMHLDDIEHESAPRVEQYLSEIKVIRSIAHKIIAFLEQLENFQKKLWLKKKFVVETNYCITLDRVPEELYKEIAANDAQREEWVRLFAIDQIKKDLHSPGYSKPLKPDFLKANQFLVLDTAFFPGPFKDRLIAQIENMSTCEGLLIHSDNFHALQLLQAAYGDTVKAAYCDPPYNTGNDDFPYKDAYQHSSWMSMVADRLALVRHLLKPSGVVAVSIDENEAWHLRGLLEAVYGADNYLTDLVWEGSSKNDQKYFSISHEYVQVAIRNKEYLDSTSERWLERKKGLDEIYAAFKRTQSDHPGNFAKQSEALKAWYSALASDHPAKDWSHYNRVEKRGIYFPDNISKPAKGYFYDVLHPVTGKPCKKPKGGWRFIESTMKDELAKDLIHFGPDESTVPCRKSFLHETEFMSPRSVLYQDGRAATNLVRNMLGERDLFTNPKDTTVLSRLLSLWSAKGDIVIDPFAGSGSTAHALFDLVRQKQGIRKFILVEMSPYFDTATRVRIERAIYSSEWKDGLPTQRDGMSMFFKYMRLESYEDSLTNLELKRTHEQGAFLDADADLREQYILSYMLDIESRGSQSLLNIDNFRNPDQYKLRVERNGETQLVNVDLVETFNWLLGLTVKHIDVIRGVRVVEATNPSGGRVLVLWRNIDQMDNDALDKWFQKQDYNTREMVYDLFYVNGDNNLENLRRPDQTWKVRLIEEEFQRLMFDVEDI
jgi:adenine-specific DNA-methyltransferase